MLNEINSLQPKDTQKEIVILSINGTKSKETIHSNEITKNKRLNSLQNIISDLGVQLQKGSDIISNKDMQYDFSGVKEIIKELEIIFKKLKELDIQMPMFINGLGEAKNTISYCEKFKKDFKD